MNPEIKNDEHKCDCKCGFGDIIPKIMKFNLGEIISFVAIFLFLVIFVLGFVTFKAFVGFILPIGIFTGIFFLIFLFAEKFTCFENKYLKLINSILLGITSIGFITLIFFVWDLPKNEYGMKIFGLDTGFSIESLILFILILGANAYWAYDIIIGFIAKQKEESAKREAEEAEKAAEEPKKEEEKVEEKPAEEPAKEEEKSEEEEKEEEAGDDEEEKKDE